MSSRSDWPLPPLPEEDEFAAVYAGLPVSAHSTGEYRAVDDPSSLSFGSDPLNAPLQSEPSPLRLVDTPAPDPLTDPIPTQRTEPPVLRVIDGGRQPWQSEPAPTEADSDLLIFAQTHAHSAWFTLSDSEGLADEPPTWGGLADEGWRAAEQVARPAVGAETMAGLPRRVPQANLVPGSAQPPSRQLRIVRDAQSIAAHTSGYFRGWQRGQEIGGFAVGQRDRGAWEFNREQRAREGGDQRDQRARLS